MTRRIALWLPCLAASTVFSACGGVADPTLFSNSGRAGGGSQGGESSSAGADPGPGGATSHAGSTGVAGDEVGGASSEGGASSGGGAAQGGAAQGGAAHGGAAQGGASHGGAAQGGAAQGGAAQGGNAGSGGTSGELTCSELFALAEKQLAAARVCNIAADSLQCTGKVSTLCGCQVPVERANSAETNAYLATQKQIEKQHCVQLCPAIACFPVNSAQCKASPGSTAGTCVASNVAF